MKALLPVGISFECSYDQQPIKLQDFYNLRCICCCLPHGLILIGCLEREYLKNGLRSDVNSKLKSDPIIEIDFRYSLDRDWNSVMIKEFI